MIASPAGVAVVVAVALVSLSACTPQRPPRETVLPPPVSVAPTPTTSPTPSQQELSAQSEDAFRTAVKEMERLQRAGGAAEASPLLRSVVAEAALATYEFDLKDQKKRGYTVVGSATTHVRQAPGISDMDYDERLTLRYCDDGSSLRWTEKGQATSGVRVQGWAYGRLIDGKAMIVDFTSEEVEQCDYF